MYSLTPVAHLSFTTPAMWAGVTLAVFPLVAHLLNRYARTRRIFPSLILLQQSAVQQARASKWRRWLLLGLRCLFVVALAAAFARPVWRTHQFDAVAASEPNAAVLLVDVSASMQLDLDGVTRIDLAKAAGIRILNDLRSGIDQANIIFVASRPSPVFAELSPNLSALQNELQRQAATEESADMVAGLAAAARMLRGFEGTRRLVILSDLQAVTWQPLLSGRPNNPLPQGTQVALVDLETKVPPNVAIHFPRTDPAQPLLGQTVNLTAQLHNYASQTRRVTVRARVDQQWLSPIDVELQPGQEREVAFESGMEATRPHEIVFHLDHDRFPLDDRCYLSAQSRPQLPVAVATDDAEFNSADYYVSLALAPHGDARDRFAITRLAARDLATTQLDPLTAVFVGYLGQLEPMAADALLRYVERGGACVFFCGQGPVQRNLLTLDALRPAGCLPWIPRERVDLFRQRRSAHIVAGKWRARLLREFDLTSQVALSTVRFGRIWRVDRVRAEAETLLSFADGTPALATRRVGHGQFVLANFSPDTDSSDLGKHGAFVALMQILAQNLRLESAAEEPIHVGQPLVHRLGSSSEASAMTIVDPKGQTLDSTVKLLGETAQIRIDSTSQAGIYQILHGEQLVAAVPVNIDPSESDLRPAPRAAVLRAVNPDPRADAASHVVSTATWHKPIDLEGRPLWGWMILAAMTAIAAELALLGWWRR